MLRFIKHIIIICLLQIVVLSVYSQSYPVQANLYVLAPYSQTYSDYYADGQQRMFVNILMNDMSQGQLDVVLRFSIKGNNLRLTTNTASPLKPITIQSGRLYRVEGTELAQYLKSDQMQVEGRLANEFRKSGRLPEGYYEIKVEVVEYYRKARVSAPAYSTAWIVQPEPPTWTMPQNGTLLEATNPQFVLFGWMLTGNTTMLQNPRYIFSIYEKPANINADVVTKTASPIYKEELSQTTLVYGPDKPLLELGKTYVCRVQATDADGRISFKNEGYSSALVFRYGQECLPPQHVTITDITTNGATANWLTDRVHNGFDIEVRETTEGNVSDWYSWKTDQPAHNYNLKMLSPERQYECRIAAICGQRTNGIRSQYSQPVTFKTLVAGGKEYKCGEAAEIVRPTNRVPWPYLEEGDEITSAGFPVKILSISKNSGGLYSGQCSWRMPLWKINILCDFTDIAINAEHQLIAGTITASHDEVKKSAFARLQSTAYQPVGAQVPNTFKPEKVVAVEETVDSIRIVDGQTLIYVAGKEPTKIAATDNVFVKSADGNYYAVEGGNVYPKPSNLDSEGNRQLSYTQQLVATFGYDDAMGSHPGVDSYTDAKAPFAAQYTQYQLHSNDAYATWMAVEKYRTSMAKVTVSGGDRNAIQLRNNGQSMVRTDATDSDALYMPISTDGLYEAYYTTQDNKGKDVEVVAGQLNVVSYTQQSINVCLVGVNGEFYQYSVNELSSYLNQVFGQAVTSVNLTTASIDVDKFNGTLSAKESGMLSAYNKDMKQLIRKVKKLPDYTDDTYYIMLVAKSDNPALGGFMPVNSNFGFVFAQANSGAGQMNRTIAHELAHGAFRLWHTFSGENLYTAPQGTTNNLMDYNGIATELYKYQWDYIHNPQQGIVRWMVEEEEGEAIIKKLEFVSEILETIRQANSENLKECTIKEYENITTFISDSFKIDGKTIPIKISKINAEALPIQSNNYIEYNYTDADISYTSLQFFNGENYDGEDGVLLNIDVKTDDVDLLKTYLFEDKFEEIDISDKVQWISQFDDIIKEFCKKGCCWRTCNYILQQTIGKTALPSDVSNVAVLRISENYNDLKPTNNFDERLSYMKDQLKQGNPIVVGVHRYCTDEPYNDNKATRHFVVVVGMGYDNATKKNYFRFYEVGTYPINELTVGTNQNNRLYLDSEQKIVSGYTTMTPKGSSVSPFYTITEIRTNR